jgi:hypothetical protein
MGDADFSAHEYYYYFIIFSLYVMTAHQATGFLLNLDFEIFRIRLSSSQPADGHPSLRRPKKRAACAKLLSIDILPKSA